MSHADADTATFPVIVVDDHQLVGSAVVMALRGRGWQAVECPVSATADVLRYADELSPGLALLDLDLGTGLRGEPIDELELLVGLRARGWSVLVVSAATDESRIAAAIAAGATGYLPKGASLAELLGAISAVAAGRPLLCSAEQARWHDIDKRSRNRQRQDHRRWRRLTGRELEVLECLARGDRAAAIAEQFQVSLTTVRAQIRSIHTKLDVNSQLEAVALLRRVQPTLPPSGRQS